MNFGRISDRSLAGRLLRSPLRLLPKDLRVPILQGRLRGKRWIVGASNHGCWLGSFEYEKRTLFERYVGLGDVVFDIGAHVGFYTLLASELVGPAGRVVAFEPVARNLSYLREHVRMNGAGNVEVVEAAVSDSEGEAMFLEAGQDQDQSIGGLDSAGGLRVRTVTLDDAVSDGLPAPTCLKMDVEGAEALVLRGGSRVLKEARPVIFLATHGPGVHRACVDMLRSHAYRVGTIAGQSDELLAIPGAAPSHD